jgi:hypothetical protein
MLDGALTSAGAALGERDRRRLLERIAPLQEVHLARSGRSFEKHVEAKESRRAVLENGGAPQS